MAQYLFATGGHTPAAWELKGLAVACMTFIVLLVVFNTKVSLHILNAVGVVKITTLLFISITGLVVLGGHTRVENPHANFHNAFEGTTSNGYGLANALVKINFAYAGYTNAFNVVNELKVLIHSFPGNCNAKKMFRIQSKFSKRLHQSPSWLSHFYICFATSHTLPQVSLISRQDSTIIIPSLVPKAELVKSKELAASLFFSKVFGAGNSTRALNFLISLSAFGNLVAVIIGSSRIIRECGRQGVIPYPRIWASTKPFNTPLAPYILKWSLTVLMILAPPAGDAFNFIVDLQSYPHNVFYFATTFGLLLIRRRRARLGLSAREFKTWYAAIFFSLLINVFILVMPWYPPPGGRFGGDVSFWYATYCVVGLAM